MAALFKRMFQLILVGLQLDLKLTQRVANLFYVGLVCGLLVVYIEHAFGVHCVCPAAFVRIVVRPCCGPRASHMGSVRSCLQAPNKVGTIFVAAACIT